MEHFLPSFHREPGAVPGFWDCRKKCRLSTRTPWGFFSQSQRPKSLESLGLWQQHMESPEAVGLTQKHKIPAHWWRGRGGVFFSFWDKSLGCSPGIPGPLSEAQKAGTLHVGLSIKKDLKEIVLLFLSKFSDHQIFATSGRRS